MFASSKKNLVTSVPIFSFECDMIRKLSAHNKLRNVLLLSQRSKKMPLVYQMHSPSTLAKIWVAIFSHKRGASTQASVETKATFNAVKHGLSFQPRPLTQKDRNQPPMRVCGGPKNWTTRFGFASSKAVLISKLVKFFVGFTTLYHVSTRDSFHPVIPNAFAVSS